MSAAASGRSRKDKGGNDLLAKVMMGLGKQGRWREERGKGVEERGKVVWRKVKTVG